MERKLEENPERKKYLLPIVTPNVKKLRNYSRLVSNKSKCLEDNSGHDNMKYDAAVYQLHQNSTELDSSGNAMEVKEQENSERLDDTLDYILNSSN